DNGTIHTERMKRVVGLAGNMPVTFHRAFDRCSDPVQALEDLIDCGCKRLLSSGQHPSVMNGLPLLAKLNTQANERIIIMPGSGLNSGNVREVLEKTKCQEVHTAARKSFSNGEVFSPESMQEKLQYVGVDQEEIKAILSQISS
ncbi:MAG: copper homeostasis protein CutC, partial [Chitinophagaceae bacterium]|nr:copper homeostasis protein CutC [Chitinophagaceae bacterium]